MDDFGVSGGPVQARDGPGLIDPDYRKEAEGISWQTLKYQVKKGMIPTLGGLVQEKIGLSER